MLKCPGMQLTSFGFRQHRSSKVTKPGKMSTLPRTPGLPFRKLLLLGKREGKTPKFLFSGMGGRGLFLSLGLALLPIQLIWQVREYTFQGGQCPNSKDTSTGRAIVLATYYDE